MSYHALGDVSTGTIVTGAISAGGALIGGIVKGADARTGGGTGPAEDPVFSTVPSFITPDATAPSSALPSWAIPAAAAAGIGIVALMTVALLKKKAPVAKNTARRGPAREAQGHRTQAELMRGWAEEFARVGDDEKAKSFRDGAQRHEMAARKIEAAEKRRVEWDCPSLGSSSRRVGMRALIVGDSMAAGPMGQRLKQLLEAQGAHVDLLANVGWTADRWVGNAASDGYPWRQVLAIVHGSPSPDVVFYILGSNDIYRADRTAPAATVLRDVGPETWFIGAPSFANATLTARVNATAPVFRRVFGSRFIDSRLYTAPNCAGRTRDCVHFTAPSGQSWANSVYAEWQRRKKGLSAGKTNWKAVGIATGVIIGAAGLAMIAKAWAR